MPFVTGSVDVLVAAGDSGDASKGISVVLSRGGLLLDGLLSVGLTSSFSESRRGCTGEAEFLVIMPWQRVHKID